MGSEEEWFNEKISSLLHEDLRVFTLNELKENLSSLPPQEAKRISNILQLPLVFDCLNNTNSEQVDLACEVLSLCLNNLNLGESTNRYGTALERALIHPYSSVKLMALREIKRSISGEDVLYSLCQKTVLIKNLIGCLKDKDLGVAKEASDIIVNLGITVPGINVLTSNECLKVLQETLNENEVVRLRVYEMVTNISKKSDLSFGKLKAVGIVKKILEELDSNDVLLKMNAIEVLSILAQSGHGFVYLDEYGILTKIYSMLDEDDVTLQLCQPGIIKFFGHITHRRPLEIYAKYPTLFDRLFANIDSADLILVGVSLDTIGHIGSVDDGKRALNSTGNKIEFFWKNISRMLGSVPTDLRVRILNCLENLLRASDLVREVTTITHEWFTLLGPDPMDVVLRYAKNPFSELRLAGLGILNAIARQFWGQEVIKNTPGLVEFLLDREVETIKECKEAKYDIIRLLNNSAAFDFYTLDRFQQFINEGPFYVHTVTEVAIEGN